MATLSTQQIQITGTAPTYAAAAGGGDAVAPGDHTFLHVKNGGGAPITATVVTPGTIWSQNVPDVAVTVANGAEKMIGPLVAGLASSSTGLVPITYSDVTSVTVAAVRV